MAPTDRTRSLRDLTDFRVLTLNCECRFSDNYLLWDRAGAIWSEFMRANPEARPIKVEPNHTVFRIREEYEFTVRLDRLAVSACGSASAERFGAVVGSFAEIVIGSLHLEEFSRIGLRPIFVHEYPDVATATAELIGLDLLRLPPSPTFGVAVDRPQTPRYSLRWEDETKGCLVQILVNTRKYEPDLPFAWEGSEIAKIEKTDLIFDVDYYTTQATTVGKVNVAEWIRQAMHVIQRDASVFFGAPTWQQVTQA